MNMKWSETLFPIAIFTLFAILTASFSHAGIFKWTDGEGRTHYTDDPASIPPEHREKSGEMKMSPPRHEEPAAVEEPVSAYSVSENSTEVKALKEIHAPIKRRGFGFTIEALLNGSVRATLLVDTGASHTVITPEIARRLEYDIKTLPRKKLATAAGASAVGLVTFDSVDVAGAKVRNVEGAVSKNVAPGTDGLLGMSFLGNFVHQVDGVKGVLVLSSD